MSTYTDENGYKRYETEHSNLVHRTKAFKHIYKKNRDKYPLPFREYVIHHKNGRKKDNRVENLQILKKEEHERIHNIVYPNVCNIDYSEVKNINYPNSLDFGMIVSRFFISLVIFGIIFGIYSLVNFFNKLELQVGGATNIPEKFPLFLFIVGGIIIIIINVVLAIRDSK